MTEPNKDVSGEAGELEEPRPLMPGEKFRFACHKGLRCFTHCCRDLNLFLSPYDILRLKNRLGISSGDFLRKYGSTNIGIVSGFPVMTLRMNKDQERTCPFVTLDGCTVYADRPASCRTYPLGRLVEKNRDTNRKKETYFVFREDHCLGFEEPNEWSIEEWLDDQEIKIYNEMNDLFMELIVSRDRAGIKNLTDEQMRNFALACYNLDKFKDMAFTPGFLEEFDLSVEYVTRLRSDELELMKFGIRWTQFMLFGERIHLGGQSERNRIISNT